MKEENKKCNCGYEKENGHAPTCPLYEEEKWQEEPIVDKKQGK